LPPRKPAVLDSPKISTKCTDMLVIIDTLTARTGSIPNPLKSLTGRELVASLLKIDTHRDLAGKLLMTTENHELIKATITTHGESMQTRPRKATVAGHIEITTRITTGHAEVPKTATIMDRTESTTKIMTMTDHAKVRTADTLADHIESTGRTLTGRAKARRVATIAGHIESTAKTMIDDAKARQVTTVADHIESTVIEITTIKGPKIAPTVIYIVNMVKPTINHAVARRTGTNLDPFAIWILPAKKL
jgi:hypothetical protein